MNRFRHGSILRVVHAGNQDRDVGSRGTGQLPLELVAATDWKHVRMCERHRLHAEHSPVVRSKVTAPRRWNRPSRKAPRATSAGSGAAVTEMTRKSPVPAPSQSDKAI